MPETEHPAFPSEQHTRAVAEQPVLPNQYRIEPLDDIFMRANVHTPQSSAIARQFSF
jgi:hypothetical protein